LFITLINLQNRFTRKDRILSQTKRKWGIGPIDAFIEKHGLRQIYEALDPPQVAQVSFRGQVYKFFIPDAMTDKMQLPPLLGQFHELPMLSAFASCTDTDGVICDLGANFGSHTLFFAAVMGAQHVHSFEPQSHLVEVIKTTLALNNVENVTLHNAVAGAKRGVAHLRSENAENSGMAEFRPGDGTTSVPMVPVDEVIGDAHVTGANIDVEGMQMPVLRGMSKTICRCNPVLWLELRPAKGEIEQPSEWLAKRGYKRFPISPRDFIFLPEGHPKA
jgi:FkbM family methyltransferase